MTHIATEAETRAIVNTAFAEALRKDTLGPLKSAVLALVQRERSPTLAAIARLPGAAGTKALVVTGKNIVLWDQLSWDAISAITELQLEGVVRLVPTDMLVYLAEGVALDLPLVKSARTYKTRHWLPTVLVAGGASP